MKVVTTGIGKNIKVFKILLYYIFKHKYKDCHLQKHKYIRKSTILGD